MKNLFLSVVLLLTASFAFATNDVETVSVFDVNEIIQLDSVDGAGQCWVQVIVTATNTVTGESYSYTYWAYAGSATDLADCKKKAAAFVAKL